MASGLLLIALGPVGASAQTVEGRVVEYGDEDMPVGGATVTLADTTGQDLRTVVADSAGHFWLWHSVPGSYRLRVERIGYATVAGQPVRLVADSVVQLEIGLRPAAVAIDPIRVVTRREVRRYTVDEFYDRMGRLEDRGTFLTRDVIDAMRVGLPSKAIERVPGTWVEPTARSTFENDIFLVNYGGRCTPAIYLDGRKLRDGETLDQAVLVDRLEGVEVYRGNFAPDGYHRDPESWGCGFVLAWTRPEPDPRFAFAWGRTLVFGVLGALVLGASFLF